jgi:flagellar FliL protein
MSDAKEAKEFAGTVSDAAPKGGVGLVPLVLVMICTVMLVLAAVGGAIYWLSKSGRLPIAGSATSAKPVAAKAETVKTRVVVLEPLLVNLSDQGGGGYLRLVVALEVEDPPPGKDAKPKEEKPAEKGKVPVNEVEVKMRDAALSVLGRETSEALLAPEGKELLKKQLSRAISEHLPEVKVVDVMFTEFLVQR